MKKENAEELPEISIEEDEGMTIDEALAKVAMILAQTRNPATQTEIDEPEIKAIASLLVVARKMNDKMLEDFCKNFMLLRVSKNRKGRSELLEIARATRDNQEQKLSRLRTLFSGITGR